jgi:RNA-directed DNA polymerase
MKHTPICDKAVLEQWLKSGVMIDAVISPTEEGTPQGGIISPMLCNVALNGMEESIKGAVKKQRGISPGIKVVRYADDVVITGKSKKVLDKCMKNLEAFLALRGLALNKTKTSIKHIKEGIDFLGFNIRRQKGTIDNRSKQNEVLIVKPSKKGIMGIMAKIKSTIQIPNIREIICKLNPILRG